MTLPDEPTAVTTVDEPGAQAWVVAVGASAGGLEALQKFFAVVQPPTQAAFIVIQHLAPDHRSMMVELLGRHCSLPVREAVAGEPLLADQVYLLPPAVVMTLQQARLVLAPRPQHGVSLPIDLFLRSLAIDHASHAIGVVLSGSGSDGAAGSAALRAAGGYVMVQTPETARFDSMPRSVMAATTVDAVLPPEDLAGQVLALTQGRAGRLPAGPLVDVATVKPALQRLFDSLMDHASIDFGLYKLPTVTRRIERRMLVLGAASLADYADRVDASQEECEALRRELLIPVTGFFRDPAAFAALTEALREQIRHLPPGRALRLWSAGCATGEEAYSLAIAALEACSAEGRWPGVKVFATDVDPAVLAVGSTGSYPAGSAEGLTPERLARHFVDQQDRLLVKPELRQLVLFARHNLLDDAPFTKMDVVVCRNTLIYFQAEAQERVMRRLQYALNAQGVLFLGSSESLGALQSDLAAVLAGGPEVEREVLGPLGSSYLVRALGYGETLGLARRAVMTLIDVSRLRDVKRLQAVIDSMPAHIAVLDKQGSIRRVNAAWTRFALRNGAMLDAGGNPRLTGVEVGANYLGALAHATSPDALEVLRGLQQVLAGQRDHYQVTYPCHSPTEQRWFAMQVTRLQGDEAGAVVCHYDITPWRGALDQAEAADA